MQVGTSSLSPLSRGTDYAFISAFAESPRFCPSYRFATPQSYECGVAETEASPDNAVAYRGHAGFPGRGLPTALPAVYRLALDEAAGLGFAVMSGIITWDHSHAGQLFAGQGISLP